MDRAGCSPRPEVPEAAASCLCLDGDHLTHGSGGNFTFIQTITIIIKIVDSGPGALNRSCKMDMKLAAA